MPKMTQDDLVVELWESLHNPTYEEGKNFLEILEKLLTNKNNNSIINTDKKERRLKKMSLEKAIKSGKEHRKDYRYDYAKSVDKQCRNHGSCSWCRENRLHKFKKVY